MPQQELIEIATGPREQFRVVKISGNTMYVCTYLHMVCVCVYLYFFFNLCTANKIIKFGRRGQQCSMRNEKNTKKKINKIISSYAGLRGKPFGRDIVGNLRLPVPDEMQLFTCHIVK